MGTRRSRLNLFVAALSLGACAPESPDVSAEDVTTVQSDIVNGTTVPQGSAQFYGTVAIYHPPKGGGAGWSARPCSGIIFQTTSGSSVILTARHCVTVDGKEETALAPPNRIAVMPGATPGLAGSSPPAGAVTSLLTLAPTPLTSNFENWDQALVWVPGDWSPLVSAKHGVLVTAPSYLADVQSAFTAFGYGITQADGNCGSDGNTTGAGTLRSGNFTITFGTPTPTPPTAGGYYSYDNNVAGGPRLFCGDSGGPDITFLGVNGGSFWMHIIGVHHSGAGTLGSSSAPSQWLQSTIGGLYMSPDSNRNYNIYVGPSPSFFASLVTRPSQSTTMRYDPYTQKVWVHGLGVNGRCLAGGGNGSAAVLAACDGVSADQRWTITADRRIRNVWSGLCLTAASTSLVMNFCSDAMPQLAAQLWAFHPQQWDNEPYTFCSNEYEQCSFTGTKSVRYGANGSYFYKVLTNGAACNNTTFGDPIPGVVKQCAIGPAGFNHCANQNGTCSFTGTKLVAYGARNSFFYKPFTNSASCTAGAFGGDPIGNVDKACYVAP